MILIGRLEEDFVIFLFAVPLTNHINLINPIQKNFSSVLPSNPVNLVNPVKNSVQPFLRKSGISLLNAATNSR